MKDLTTAIYSKATGSSFLNAVSSRFYKGRAPEGADYPYAVYMLVSGYPDDVFNGDYENVLFQFSLFSTASGSTEIEDIFTYLTDLYDDCDLTISNETLIYMRRENYSMFMDEHTTPKGTIQVWAYHIDYRILVEV